MASLSPPLSLPLFLAVFLLLSSHAISTHSPESSPAHPPQPPTDEHSPSPATPSAAPSPAPAHFSPPAPPPSDLAPNSPSPAPTPQKDEAPHKKTPSPAPEPATAEDASDEDKPNAGDIEAEEKSSGGMSSAQKAGVAIGVIAGVGLVGAGALVYKKRQQNIQRAQFGYAAREIL